MRMQWMKNKYNNMVFIAFEYQSKFIGGVAGGYHNGKWRNGFSTSQDGEKIDEPPRWKYGFLKYMFEEGFEELIANGNMEKFEKDLNKL